MQKHIGWLWSFGLFSLVVAADAQTASPPAAITQFDGTYAFVSSTKVNEFYYGRGDNRIGQCGDRRPKSIVIQNGQARLPIFEGTVGPHGELEMRHVSFMTSGSGLPGTERVIYGRIDAGGTVRAREIARGCNYDITWQKISQ